jgi:hypothetical protein
VEIEVKTKKQNDEEIGVHPLQTKIHGSNRRPHINSQAAHPTMHLYQNGQRQKNVSLILNHVRVLMQPVLIIQLGVVIK